MGLRWPGLAALGLVLAFSGCWSLTADLDNLTEPLPTTRGIFPPAKRDPVEASVLDPIDGVPYVPPAVDGGFCSLLGQDAGATRSTSCFDYEATDAAALRNSGFGESTFGIATDSSKVLQIDFPPLPSSAAGRSQEIPTSALANRVLLAFDVKIEGDLTKLPQFIHLGGFIRDSIYAYLIYEGTAKKLSFAEQDQRNGGLINVPLKGFVPLDLGTWRRIELEVNFETKKVTTRVINGPTAENLTLEIPDNAPTGFGYVGLRYIDATSDRIVVRYDNVVLQTF